MAGMDCCTTNQLPLLHLLARMSETVFLRPDRKAHIDRTWQITVNGQTAEISGEAEDPLVFALRNELGLVATRLGCGLEQCGACRIRLGSEEANAALTWACTTRLMDAEGACVTTLEGLENDPLMVRLRAVFETLNAAQCGYCTTGILMAAHDLLSTRRGWDRAELAQALDGQLCRCGSQDRMLRAILTVDANA